jgi:hypothetical protein
MYKESLQLLQLAFKDSKGNPANSVVTPGAVTIVAPMLTAISSTGSATTLLTTRVLRHIPGQLEQLLV